MNLNELKLAIVESQNEIVALVEAQIAKMDEEDAQDFIMDLQEKISELLPN